MTKDEIKILKIDNTAPIKIRSIAGKRGILKINGKIAIPVEATSNYFETSLDIAVFDESNSEIGNLCFTSKITGKTWNMLTEDQFIAFLTEAQWDDIGSEYRFKIDYLVISAGFYERYLTDYAKTSAVWGGFSHVGITSLPAHKTGVTRIDLKHINLDNNILSENATRSVLQPFAFERYLKLYHLLELRFDSEIVEEIKGIDYEASPELIAEILNNYNKTEFPRLLYIIEKHCSNIPRLVAIMNQVINFLPKAKLIFYKFGKDSNPLKEEAKFDFLSINGFTEANVKSQNLAPNSAAYILFMKKLLSYWIYRFRSSIAHSKIGEYILGHNDEPFVAEFAEPLIKETIIQCFKRP